MQFILDTNICIYIIKKKPEQVLKRLSKIDPSTIAISSITSEVENMYNEDNAASVVKVIISPVFIAFLTF